MAIFCYILTLPDEIKIIVGKMFRFLLVFLIERRCFFFLCTLKFTVFPLNILQLSCYEYDHKT